MIKRIRHVIFWTCVFLISATSQERTDLKRILVQRSKSEGLAIGRLDLDELRSFLFDGSSDERRPCPPLSRSGLSPRGNRVICIGSGDDNPIHNLLKGGVATIRNLDGKVIETYPFFHRPQMIMIGADEVHFAMFEVSKKEGIRLLAGSLGDHDVLEVFTDPSGDEKTMWHSVGWNPSGDLLAYSRLGNIYLFDRTKRESRFLVRGDNPTWSPDGSHIAYKAPNGQGMLVGRNGHGPTILIPHAIKYALHWSPDGRMVLFSEDMIGEKNVSTLLSCPVWTQLVVVRLNDGASTVVRQPCLGEDDSGYEWVQLGPQDTIR